MAAVVYVRAPRVPIEKPIFACVVSLDGMHIVELRKDWRNIVDEFPSSYYANLFDYMYALQYIRKKASRQKILLVHGGRT